MRNELFSDDTRLFLLSIDSVRDFAADELRVDTGAVSNRGNEVKIDGSLIGVAISSAVTFTSETCRLSDLIC
jgi:hypothetical protein